MAVAATGDRGTPRGYEIRIKGHLEPRWAGWFEGLALSAEPDGTTVLHGPVADQAALHGLLQKLRDVGLPLISVAEVVVTDPWRKVALFAGVLYLLTFVAGIPPALALYNDVLNDPAFILGSGGGTAVVWGGLLEIVNAIACIGTAVVLFPVVKRQSEAAALGFVTARVMEAGVILLGVVSVLSIVTLRQDIATTAGAEAASLVALGHALVTVHEWTALIGPGLVPAFNALLLGYVLYRSGLVPRVIPAMGLVGAPLLLIAFVAALFGGTEQISGVWALAVVPIFFWELSLGLYMTFKGFRPSSSRATAARPGRRREPGARPQRRRARRSPSRRR